MGCDVATNNQAEYQTLIKALKYAIEIKAAGVDVRSDSELIVNQMNVRCRVQKEELKPLYAGAKTLAALIEKFTVKSVSNPYLPARW